MSTGAGCCGSLRNSRGPLENSSSFRSVTGPNPVPHRPVAALPLVPHPYLTVPRTIELYQQFRGRCLLAFGIGTNLTNDLGYEPLQIVIKMVRCNGQPVAKLSDTPSKNMCDDERYLAYLRQVFDIPQVS